MKNRMSCLNGRNNEEQWVALMEDIMSYSSPVILPLY